MFVSRFSLFITVTFGLKEKSFISSNTHSAAKWTSSSYTSIGEQVIFLFCPPHLRNYWTALHVLIESVLMLDFFVISSPSFLYRVVKGPIIAKKSFIIFPINKFPINNPVNGEICRTE